MAGWARYLVSGLALGCALRYKRPQSTSHHSGACVDRVVQVHVEMEVEGDSEAAGGGEALAPVAAHGEQQQQQQQQGANGSATAAQRRPSPAGSGRGGSGGVTDAIGGNDNTDAPEPTQADGAAASPSVPTTGSADAAHPAEAPLRTDTASPAAEQGRWVRVHLVPEHATTRAAARYALHAILGLADPRDAPAVTDVAALRELLRM